MRRRLRLVGLALFLVVILLPGTRAATIQGQVTDAQSGTPIAGANVSLYRAGESVPLVRTVTDASGRYSISGLAAGDYRIEVSAPQYPYQAYATETRTITLGANDTVTEDLAMGSRAPTAFSQTALGIPFLLPVALVAASLLVALGFARIHRSELLQNAVRQRIYEHIRSNAGAHYRAILGDLDLAMGVLTYHLNRLERGGYITSYQDGVYRRFFPAGQRAEVTFFLTELQQRIVLALRQNGGISQVKLAERLAVSRPLVNYHLHILANAGFVRLEPRGRETGCFLVEG